MPPPDNHLIRQGRQLVQDGELGRNLGTANDGNQGPLRVLERAGQGIQLRREERSGTGHRGESGNAVGRSLGSVCRGERVHDEDVRKRRQALCQRRVVGLLTGQEAYVLQQGNPRRRSLGGFEVGQQRHLLAEQPRQVPGYRRQ